MTTLTVATFNTAGPAERLRERLENHGVPAVVRDQRTLQRFWFLAKPFAAFHLDVEKDYVDRAKGLLWDWQESKHLLAEAIRCPMTHCSRGNLAWICTRDGLKTLRYRRLGTAVAGAELKFAFRRAQVTLMGLPRVTFSDRAGMSQNA